MEKSQVKTATKILFSALIVIGVFCLIYGESYAKEKRNTELGSVSEPIEINQSGNYTYNLTGVNSWVFREIQVSGFYDDIIEDGFPVSAYHSAGTFHGGPAVHTNVVNLSPRIMGQQIVFTGLASGPLYAYDHTGNPVPGWPVTTSGASYPVSFLGRVVMGSWGKQLRGYDFQGQVLWSRTASNYISTPGSMDYMSYDLGFGFFIGEEDWKVHGYDPYTGGILPGWPTGLIGNSQEFHTPALADLDNDGVKEIIAASGTGNNMFKLVCINLNGTTRWTKTFYGEVDTFPVVGDVDGDGEKEIVVVITESPSWANRVVVLDKDGNIEQNWVPTGSSFWGTAPALADINGDNIPEIIIQMETSLNVTDYMGNQLPGWPKTGLGSMGGSAPVVGDIDGDGQLEIVITSGGYLRAFNADGQYVDGFPLQISYLGSGAVPAIADIDYDGHNEIVVTGNYWNGQSGYFPKLWVFDLNRDEPEVKHGRIEWGQFGGNSRHTNEYLPATTD